MSVSFEPQWSIATGAFTRSAPETIFKKISPDFYQLSSFPKQDHCSAKNGYFISGRIFYRLGRIFELTTAYSKSTHRVEVSNYEAYMDSVWPFTSKIIQEDYVIFSFTCGTRITIWNKGKVINGIDVDGGPASMRFPTYSIDTQYYNGITSTTHIGSTSNLKSIVFGGGIFTSYKVGRHMGLQVNIKYYRANFPYEVLLHSSPGGADYITHPDVINYRAINIGLSAAYQF